MEEGELLLLQKDWNKAETSSIFGSIVLTFFICWTPYYVYLFLKSFYPSIFLKDKCLFLVGLFYCLFPILSTVTNTFILMLFSTSYREAIKSLCISSCLLPKRPSRRIAPVTVSQQARTLRPRTHVSGYRWKWRFFFSLFKNIRILK